MKPASALLHSVVVCAVFPASIETARAQEHPMDPLTFQEAETPGGGYGLQWWTAASLRATRTGEYAIPSGPLPDGRYPTTAVCDRGRSAVGGHREHMRTVRFRGESRDGGL